MTRTGETAVEPACGNCSVCKGRPTTSARRPRKKRVRGPSCPECEGEMRRRANKSGEPFWGCARYPLCRGTVDIPEEIGA